MSNFFDFMNIKKGEIENLITMAEKFKRGEILDKPLKDKMIGLLFNVPSTRTRISFQAAIKQLGGEVATYNSQDLQLANKESMKDTATVMGKYLDGLVVRWYNMNDYGYGRNTLNEIADSSNLPVINALDDKDHPCQILADILTLKEKYGENYRKKKVLFTWGYADRKKSPGCTHSMLTAASILGMDLRIAHPKGFELDNEYLSFAENAARQSGANIEFSNDLDESIEGVDVVYAKAWGSLSLPGYEEQKYKCDIKDQWLVNSERFARANSDAYFINPLPIIRGDEATADIIDGPRSLMYQTAENRLHVQKATLTSLYSR
ncbi:ornithine carbamoyltransferase [Peribacillus simplex]|uniref:ornithine carbamoyltransferase n=1 Tax=Peribacillus simplex TaxID=1478 RepID=UPI003D2C9836